MREHVLQWRRCSDTRHAFMCAQRCATQSSARAPTAQRRCYIWTCGVRPHTMRLQDTLSALIESGKIPGAWRRELSELPATMSMAMRTFQQHSPCVVCHLCCCTGYACTVRRLSDGFSVPAGNHQPRRAKSTSERPFVTYFHEA
jgi:hypothetical protein